MHKYSKMILLSCRFHTIIISFLCCSVAHIEYYSLINILYVIRLSLSKSVTLLLIFENSPSVGH